jgi:1-acyl-sn-glycerol-3-phosphate acyltransferase
MRLTLRAAAIVAGLIVCVPLHYLWKLGRRPSPWPRRFLGWVGRAAGMRTRIVGSPVSAPVLFVANHSTWLDIMLVAGATGAAFVSRDDVARWPVVGWLARLNDTVFVDRSERKAVRGQADALRDALLRGKPVALFPEGTTGGGGGVLPFRPSLLSALYPPQAGVKVQPIAIDYGPAGGDLAWGEEEGAPANARRILSRPGTTPVTLRFLEPIDPADFPDRKGLALAARAEIVAALPSAATADRL